MDFQCHVRRETGFFGAHLCRSRNRLGLGVADDVGHPRTSKESAEVHEKRAPGWARVI